MRRAVLSITLCLGLLSLGLLQSSVGAFNPNSDNNLVNYWGQNSYGAAGGDIRYWQKPLADYCQKPESEDVIVIAFLHVFNSTSRRLPAMDLSNQCGQNSAFPGTQLLRCPQTGEGVKMCQSKGKAVILSLGGAAGAYGFSDDTEAKDFAHTIWNLFLGGSSTTRPMDDAILDGVDLDIEGGSAVGYPAFIAELRSLFATDPRKQYFITAAPQCPFPAYGSFNFNFDEWDNWAKTISINKNVKVYLGAPASRTAANAGYATVDKLQEIMDNVRCKYSSFGGVMMWDISQSYGNLESGIEYNVAAAKNLKRPRHLVCGGDEPAPVPPPTPVPAPPADPVPQPTLAPPPPPVPAPAPTTDVSEPVPTTGSSAPSTPVSSPASAPTTSVPSNPPDDKEPSQCPVKRDLCQWVFQRCAPSTYCTPRGCDFEKGPVKSCKELEKEKRAEKALRTQMQDAIDLMWGVFGNFVDSTWDSYIDVDETPEEEDTPVVSDNDPQDDAPQQQLPQQQQQQKSFHLPEVVTDVEGKIKDTSDDYLIDFVELEAEQDFVSFAIDPEATETTQAFRTQVRIRTNGDAIHRLWRVSFFVKPGETIKSVSRGTFVQNGPHVFVTSKPKEEVHKSMVVRFVIEGVRTVDPLSNPVGAGNILPDSYQEPDIFAPQGLPDPAFAKFETKAVKL
ncbi:Chitinase 1 [Mortierella sp. AD031]|nr:Chitinase 1 [Mortierella sp. AD031]